MEERKIREIEHSDRRRAIVKGYEYRTDVAESERAAEFVADENEYSVHFSNMKFYSITRSSVAHRDALLYEGIEGAVALDYCCGNGEVGVEMAAKGAAKVWGIDISQVAVDNATALAQAHGVGSRCEFKVMDAEHTEFGDSTFDVIHEYGALHHLDLDAAFKELSRILKPGGKLVCTEALRHNPVIHWYRKRTPHLRTEWEAEHILGVPEIEGGRRHFGSMQLRFFHLAALAAVPFRKTSAFKPLLAVMEAVDSVLLRIPLVCRNAWIAVIQYSDPKKSS